jgi:hypothetical protein
MPVVHQNVRAAARRQCRTVLLRQTPRYVLGSVSQAPRYYLAPKTKTAPKAGTRRARSAGRS